MILVTGASGLLGASVVARAVQQGREVVGLYHRHPVNLPGATLLQADLADDSRVQALFDELHPESVIHCAAQTDVDWCQQHREDAWRINVTASAAIARITSRSQASFLFISTDSVFDGSRGNYSETDVPAPVNIYAESKLAAEHQVLASNPAAAIARVTIYGWNVQKKLSLAEWMLEQLIQGRSVPGFGDIIFCPIFADDLAEILLAMVDRQLRGVYHVAGSQAISKYEFGKRIAAMFGFDGNQIVPTSIADLKLKASRPGNTSLNTEKICRALRCSMPDVDSGLHNFFKSRPEGWGQKVQGGLTEVRE